jgi:quinol monooxygenase YgiN
VKPDNQEEFESILKEMVAGTLANDKGCLRYEWYRSDAPDTYVLLESWTDRAAVISHLQAPHMVSTRSRIASMAAADITFASLSKL